MGLPVGLASAAARATKEAKTSRPKAMAYIEKLAVAGVFSALGGIRTCSLTASWL